MTLPPSLYDAAQVLLGARRTIECLRPHVGLLNGGRVLDVGGGTGLYAAVCPPSATYVCLDHDAARLKHLLSKRSNARVILGDATGMAVGTQSIECALCIGVAHHLADEPLQRLLSELARVVTTRLVFLEPLRRPESFVSRVLWRADAGSYPRSSDALVAALSAWFTIHRTESFAIHHHYLLCVASPRRA